MFVARAQVACDVLSSVKSFAITCMESCQHVVGTWTLLLLNFYWSNQVHEHNASIIVMSAWLPPLINNLNLDTVVLCLPNPLQSLLCNEEPSVFLLTWRPHKVPAKNFQFNCFFKRCSKVIIQHEGGTSFSFKHFFLLHTYIKILHLVLNFAFSVLFRRYLCNEPIKLGPDIVSNASYKEQFDAVEQCFKVIGFTLEV